MATTYDRMSEKKPWIYRLSLPWRFVALLVIPVSFLLLIVVEDGSDAYFDYRDFEHTAQEVKVSAKIGELVHELQLERGMSARYLSGGEQVSLAELGVQRRKVDAELAELRAFMQGADITMETHGYLLSALQQLERLTNYRTEIDSREIEKSKAFSYYSYLVRLFTKDMYGVEQRIKDPELKTNMMSYILLVEMKEAASQERGVVANLMALGAPSPAQADKARKLAAEQQAYHGLLKSFLPEDRQADLTATMKLESMGTVNAIRASINEGDLTALAGMGDTWWAASTAVVNGIKQLEDAVAYGMLNMADHAFVTFVMLVALMSVAVVAVVTMTWLVTGSIIYPITDFTGVCEVTVMDLEQVSTKVTKAYGSMMDACSDNQKKGQGIAETSQQIAMNIKEIAAATEELQASVSSTRQKVHHSAGVSKDAIGKGELAMQSLDELNVMSRSIGDIIGLITDVADRTNLLALNAAIEAARAGDSGRGFAVVAEEVKKLSQSTVKATEDINQKIKGMQGVTKQVTQNIEAVMTVVRDIYSANQEFEMSIAEQMEAMAAINHNMAEARNSLENANVSVQHMAVGLDLTHSAAQDVKQQISVMETNTGKISNEIGRFIKNVGARDSVQLRLAAA